MSWTFGPLLPAAPILLGATGPVDYTETATVAGVGAVTAPDVAARVEAATVAGAGAVTAADFKPIVETATAAGVGAVTGPDAAQRIETATVAGTGTVDTDEEELEAEETATVAGVGSLAASDIVTRIETATVAAQGAAVSDDVLEAATFDYVETGTVAGAGAVTSSDLRQLVEVASVAAEGAVAAEDVLGCIEAATAFGEAAIDALDVAVLAGFDFEETATAAGEGRMVWGDFLPFYAGSTVSSPGPAPLRGVAGASSASGGDPGAPLRSGSTRGTARTEGN